MVYPEFHDQLSGINRIISDFGIFFVVGAPKSGTTWLQRALDAHPEIVCAGEGHFMDQAGVRLSDALRKYYAHQDVVVDSVYEGSRYYPDKGRENFNFLITALILSSFSQLDFDDSVRLIGDKTPIHVNYLPLLHYLFPEARIVNIVRDGRDTLVSNIKHAERVLRKDPEAKDIDQFIDERIDTYVKRWVTCIRKADEFQNQHPESIHTLRYEDLIDDFGGTLGKALRFLGASDSPDLIQRCEEESSFRRLSGGREPGQENTSSFLRKGIAGDWKQSLTERQIEKFNQHATEWLERLGYG